MNADTYLKRHGWRGSGYSLDHTDRGIKKPLLIAHKQDQLGLGKKKAAHSVSDQWWMRAFDESLQNIGTGQESTLSQVRKQGINRGGLYSFFVKGQGLIGTIIEESSTAETSQSDSSTPLSRASTPATTASEASEESNPSSDCESTSDEDVSASTEDAVPAPIEDSKKRKREHQTVANGAQKKQRLEKADIMECEEQLEHVALRAGEAADPKAELHAATRRRIEHQVKSMIKARTLNGEYGVVLQQSSHKGASKTSIVEDPITGKRMSYKRAKFEREEKARNAKHQLRKALVVDAMMKGDLPNPKSYTRDEALHNFERDEKTLSKEEKKRTKAAAMQRKQQKAEARQERIQVREKEKAYKMELKKQERALNGPDEVPKDEADRFHSHRAKKERKLAAQAGLSVQDYRARLELERNQDAISTKIAKLSVQAKAQYEERAAKKSQSLEEYVLRRIQKKNSQHAENDAEKTDEQPSMFFTDLEGDVNLLAKAVPGHIESNKLPYQLSSDGSIPLDPVIWADRPVKSLTKEERAARLQYLRNRRHERNVASGKIKPGEAPQLSRAAKKTKNLQSLTGKILGEEMGIKEGATREQKNLARRTAKKQVRDEKKEHKRGKTNKLVQTKKTSAKISESVKEKNGLVALALSNATAV